MRYRARRRSARRGPARHREGVPRAAWTAEDVLKNIGRDFGVGHYAHLHRPRESARDRKGDHR